MSSILRCGLISLAAVMILGCGRADRRVAKDAANATPPTTEVGQGEVARLPEDSPVQVRLVADEEPSVTLTLQESAGDVTGTLSEGGDTMPLAGRRAGGGFAGSVGPKGAALPFTATEHGAVVVLEIKAAGGVQRLTFRRAAGGDATGAPGAATGQRHVVINERRLSDTELARAEQQYSIRIPDAEYWYDGTLGAWGPKGGPTMGFIAPGLELGGTLRADASRGNTNVFVNGRELPAWDLGALQRITGQIQPGRYFITAQGLAGYEGGSPQWNLANLAAQSGGGSNTWQSGLTGASGFSDGTTGAVFLPNGGIVSTGN